VNRCDNPEYRTMRKSVWLLLALVVASPFLFRLALATVLVPVDRTEFVYVTQFGKHVVTYDGARDEDAGLHARWPWPVQSVQRLDRRLQFFDLPAAELLTHDPQQKTIDRTLTIVAYVCWRITNEHDGVDWFIRSVGTPERAQALLGQRVSSRLGAVVSRMEMDDLISDQPGKVDASMKRLRDRLLEGLEDQARSDYGIEVVDVRLRRHSYPQAVRQAIFDRIISERAKKVAEYQSKGNQLAENIKNEAKRDASFLLTDARAREQEFKGRADAEADRIRNAAHAQDPEFYAFLKKLEAYQRILGDGKTVLLLAGHRELFDLLFSPPRPGATKPPAGTVTSQPAAAKGGP
jgi:membrane protease subunit HflC